MTEELNVKQVIVEQSAEVGLDLTITPELKREGLMREVIRHVQSARKAADLSIDDHIRVSFVTDDVDIRVAIHEFSDVIRAEVLADAIIDQQLEMYQTTVGIEGSQLNISLQKV
ncbi:isoleucyl-tRNA synthetase [compost metagenome]